MNALLRRLGIDMNDVGSAEQSDEEERARSYLFETLSRGEDYGTNHAVADDDSDTDEDDDEGRMREPVYKGGMAVTPSPYAGATRRRNGASHHYDYGDEEAGTTTTAFADEESETDTDSYAPHSDGSSSGEYTSSDDDDDDSDNRARYYMHRPYEVACIETDLLYWLRPGGQRRMLLLAREDHPLVAFVRMLTHNERVELARAGASPLLALGAREEKIPGVLKDFTVRHLRRRASFSVVVHGQPQTVDTELTPANVSPAPSDDGTTAEVDQVAREIDADELHVHAASGDVFDDERLYTLLDIKDGRCSRAELKKLDTLHNHNNMERFSFHGPSTPSSVTPGPFSDVSPLADDDPNRWFVITSHYYAMYAAFVQLHRSNSALCHTLRVRAAQVESGERASVFRDDTDNADDDNDRLSASQERSVLAKLFALERRYNASDDLGAHARVVEQARRLCAMRDDLSRLKVQRSAFDMPILANTPQSTLAELNAHIKSISDLLDQLTREQRNYFDPLHRREKIATTAPTITTATAVIEAPKKKQ